MRVNYENLTLCDLALSSTMYTSLTPFNTSLRYLKSVTGNSLDLNDTGHRASLVEWLNAWGCRHLSKKQHETTSTAILEWYGQAGARLFQKTKPIWDLDDHDLSGAADAYGSLKDKTAARRYRGAKTWDIHIGPTAASKILFAIRPEALMPWDEAMRIGFSCDSSPESYLKFLQDIQRLALKIRDLCNVEGFDISELPQQIDQPDSTVLELINEYIWITVTRNCTLPPASTLARWADWGSSTARDRK